MNTETIVALGAGYVPAALLPDAVAGWSGPVRYTGMDREVHEGALLASPHLAGTWAVASVRGPVFISGHVEMCVALDTISLPLARAEARHRVCVVMAAGVKCSICARDPALCSRCPPESPTRGYLRAPAPCWHLLPESEGGRLPDSCAAYSATLIAAHVGSVVDGGRGIQDLLGAWRKVSAADPDTGETWIRGRILNRGSGGLWCCSRLQTWRFFGWQNSCVPDAAKFWLEGPETGEAGKRAADASALAAGFALLDGTAVHAPCGPQMIFTTTAPEQP